MAQLAVAGAGAGVGAAFGGGAGAQFGWAGGMFLGSMIFGEDNPDIVQHGPRVQGVAVTTSAYGVMRPLHWGIVPISGNIIDRSERRETRHEQKEKSGGKGFGPSQTVTTVTYTYDIDIMLGLGVGPPPDVDPALVTIELLQLYANNQLIYDNRPDATFVKPTWLNLRFYKGTDDEQPDPTLEAIYGEGNVPAYLGEIKIMLTGFPLDQYQGQVPSFKAIVLKRGLVTAPYKQFNTPQDQARYGDFVNHPTTNTIFRTLEISYDTYGGIVTEVIDPMTDQVIQTMEVPDLDGYPAGTVDQDVDCIGFCSISVVIAGQPAVSLGPNRHFYVAGRWDDLQSTDRGYMVHIYDAFTFNHIGQFVQPASVVLPGGNFDELQGWAIFPDQEAGYFYWNVKNASSGEAGLARYTLLITDGILEGAPSNTFDFRAIARTLQYDFNDTLIRGRQGCMHNAQATDKRGNTYLVLWVFDSGNPSVTYVLIRIDNTGAQAAFNLTPLLSFADTTRFASTLIWDDTTQGIWVVGDANPGPGPAWIQFDPDLNQINSWYPTYGNPNDIPDEDFNGYQRVFDPAGVIWSGVSKAADLTDETFIWGVNTSTLKITPWFGIPNAAIGGARFTHGLAWSVLTQAVYMSDGSENNTWEVHKVRPNAVSEDTTYLSEPVYDLSKMVDVPDAQIDVSELTTIPIDGFQLISQGSARKAITQLAVAYLFDMIDTGEKAYFKVRTDTPDALIPYTDMGAIQGNAAIGGGRNTPEWDTFDVMEEELPTRVEISYFNRDAQYEIGLQEAGSQEAKGVNLVRRDLSVVMNDTTAKRLADVVLHLMRIERRKVKITVMPKWLQLTAGDVIEAERRDWDSGTIETMLMRIDKQSFQNGLVVLEGVRQSEGIFASIAQGDSSLEYDPTIPYAGIMFVDFLDIPLLREIDNDPGFYVTARGSVPGWVGGNLYKTTDDGVTWGNVATFTGPGIMGTVITQLPAPQNLWSWDHANKFTVTLSGGGELTSSTKEIILAGGANYCVVGNPGQREVVAFVNATLVDEDTYECDTLLRARLGTEWAAGIHQAGENFAILDAADLDYIIATQADINSPSSYRAVSNGNSLFGPEAMDYAFVNTGVCLLPYAPTHFKGVKEVDYDIIFYWRERTRFPQRVFWSATPSESPESYEIDVIDPDTGPPAVRTIPASTTQAPYSRADQITDFGDVDKLVDLELYQISATMGRGYAAKMSMWLKDEPPPASGYTALVTALNPTAWYTCEETQDNQLNDSQPNPLPIVYDNGARFIYGRPGALSDGKTCIQIPGQNDTFQYISATASKLNANIMSVVCLVNIRLMGALDNVQQTFFRLARIETESNLGYMTGRIDTSRRFVGRFYSAGAFGHCTANFVNDELGPVLNVDQWYQLAMVWDDTFGYRMYVDDTEVINQAGLGFDCSDFDLLINMETVFDSWDLDIQHLQFYAGQALTAQQISDLNAAR